MGEYTQQKFDEQIAESKLNFCTSKIDNPKISVIIPVYNVEKYIEKCLNSLVNQTICELEFICVIDGSTDNSAKIIYDYAEKDSRFIVIEQDNAGQGIARNRALKLAKGEYIAFVDPDDWVSHDLFEKTYYFAKKNNSDVVQFNYTEYNENSEKYKPVNWVKCFKKKHKYDISSSGKYNKENIKHGLFYNPDLHVWNRLYRRDFVSANEIRFSPTKNGEEHLFVNGVILYASNIFFLDEYLYFYRIRKNSIVNTKSVLNGTYAFENIKCLKKYLEEKQLFELYKNDYEEYAVKILYWHYYQLPSDYLEEYKKQCKEFLSDDDYIKFENMLRKETSFMQKIFSLKTKKVDGEIFKILRILGLKFILSSGRKLDSREEVIHA